MGRQRLKLIGWPRATSGGRHSLNSLQHRMGATQHYYCQILLFAFVMGINDDEELSRPRKSIKWTHKKYTSTFTYWHTLHFRVMQETENNDSVGHNPAQDPGGIIKTGVRSSTVSFLTCRLALMLSVRKQHNSAKLEPHLHADAFLLIGWSRVCLFIFWTPSGFKNIQYIDNVIFANTVSCQFQTSLTFKWIYLLIMNSVLIDLFEPVLLLLLPRCIQNNSAPLGCVYLLWHFDVPRFTSRASSSSLRRRLLTGSAHSRQPKRRREVCSLTCGQQSSPHPQTCLETWFKMYGFSTDIHLQYISAENSTWKVLIQDWPLY